MIFLKKYLISKLVFLLAIFQCHKDGTRENVEKLSIITYNVLASRYHYKTRFTAIAEILVEYDADIVAFQEAYRYFSRTLFQNQQVKEKYLYTSNDEKKSTGEYLILSKFPVSDVIYTKLPMSPRNRYVLIVNVALENFDVTVTTVHFESIPKHKIHRAKQLDFVFEKLKTETHSILLGDFNFSENAQPETSHLNINYSDVWKVLKLNKPGYTYHITENPLAKRNDFKKSYNRRIDRILVKSSQLRPINVEIIGTTAVHKNTKLVFPSDHYGVYAEFEIYIPNSKLN